MLILPLNVDGVAIVAVDVDDVDDDETTIRVGGDGCDSVRKPAPSNTIDQRTE